MKLDEALRKTGEALARAEEKLEQQLMVVADLQTEKRGLELAVQRYDAGPEGTRAPGPDEARVPDEGTSDPHQDRDWTSAPRTTAIAWALADLGSPAAPHEIATLLREKGRTGDDAANVGSTLQHLSHSGRAYKVAYGQWAAGDGSATQRETTPADRDTTVITDALEALSGTAELGV